MQFQLTTTNKIIVTLLISLFVFSVLLWEHFHGGVAGHHILHQEQLPVISNWWSGVFLPILAWILLNRLSNRLVKQGNHQTLVNIKVIGLFIAGLLFGIALAVSFTLGFNLFLDNVIFLLLFLSLLIPIFFSEFMLGFVIGMTITFGSILPTAFIVIMACLGLLLYKVVRPLIIKGLGMLKRKV